MMTEGGIHVTIITTTGEKGVTVEETDDDVEVPMIEIEAGIMMTTTNNTNKTIQGEGNENTVPPPPVPLEMIPKVTSREVEVHLLVITIVSFVMLDWEPLDESSNVNTSIRMIIDITTIFIIIIGLVIVGVEVSIGPLLGIDVTTTVETTAAIPTTTAAIPTTTTTPTLSQLKLYGMSEDITKVHSSKVTFANVLIENNPVTILTCVPE